MLYDMIVYFRPHVSHIWPITKAPIDRNKKVEQKKAKEPISDAEKASVFKKNKSLSTTAMCNIALDQNILEMYRMIIFQQLFFVQRLVWFVFVLYLFYI